MKNESIPVHEAHSGKVVGSHTVGAKNSYGDLKPIGHKGSVPGAHARSLSPGKDPVPKTGGAPTAAVLPAVKKASGKPLA